MKKYSSKVAWEREDASNSHYLPIAHGEQLFRLGKVSLFPVTPTCIVSGLGVLLAGGQIFYGFLL